MKKKPAVQSLPLLPDSLAHYPLLCTNQRLYVITQHAETCNGLNTRNVVLVPEGVQG